jgi:hypothetical protein
MNFERSNLRALDLTLSALEAEIMAAPDAELLTLDQSSPHAAAEVGALIAKYLAKRTDSLVSEVPKVRSEEQPGGWAIDSSREALRRLEVLRQLLVMRPDVPAPLRAAFSADRTPSPGELDRLTEELHRIGILPKGESDKS